MGNRKDDDSVLIFPACHKFNGKTKEFMRLANSKSSIKAYTKLLKVLKCKPHELDEKLRSHVWKGKSPHDILEEAEKD